MAGGKNAGGRTTLEHDLHKLGITQKNGKPNHPTTQGKIERLWQTLKKWLNAQPARPDTIGRLQELLDEFAAELQHPKAPPVTAAPSAPRQRVYTTGIQSEPRPPRGPTATTASATTASTSQAPSPSESPAASDTSESDEPTPESTLRLLVQNLDVTVINDPTTGEILRELTIDTTRDYQPRKNDKPPPEGEGFMSSMSRHICRACLDTSHGRGDRI